MLRLLDQSHRLDQLLHEHLSDLFHQLRLWSLLVLLVRLMDLLDLKDLLDLLVL
jgi:hypothetical protein